MLHECTTIIRIAHFRSKRVGPTTAMSLEISKLHVKSRFYYNSSVPDWETTGH